MKRVTCFLFTCAIVNVYMPAVYAQIKPQIMAAEPSAIERKARTMYERLTGAKIPIDSPAIRQMVDFLNKGDRMGAAQIATADPDFYNVTVKLMALPLTTRDETVKTPFNDMAADFIGVTRDGKDARELLTGNFYYMGGGTGIRSALIADLLLSNNHYADLESNRVNLATNLVRVEGQMIATSATTTAPNPDPAGVLTSRAFMGAHALMGTNRRLFEYTFREFLCVPKEGWADTEGSDARIARDVDRFPAGDHMKYLTSCKGCHTVMDGFRGAFAKWDFDGKGIKHSAVSTRGGGDFGIRTDANGIANKMNRNNTLFPSGYITTDDSFVNNAIRSNNAALFQWRGNSAGGKGVNAFGTIVANSRRFSQCMAKRAFETVCRKTMDATKNLDTLKRWGDEFETSGYQLKKLFESMATKTECLGE